VGSTLLGNVRVIDKLGDTPEGVLYRAKYSNGLKVALVVLHRLTKAREASDDSVALLALKHQIRRAIQIHHPNVAAVYEIGETPAGHIYAVTEYLTGMLLSDNLAERGALLFDETLDRFRQIAAGLEAAHRVGLVHGNLSPRTILITEATDGFPRVKLIGFPVLSSLGEQHSNKPIDREYASPERISGLLPAEPGDVYSLAAVLHHLLTGRPPEGSPVRSLAPGMRAVLAQALSPTPAQRFQSVAEFATAVERATAIATRPKRSGAYRSLVAVGVTLVVIVAGIWLLWNLRREPVSSVAPPQETATRATVKLQSGENTETLSPRQKSGRIRQVRPDSARDRSSARLAKGRSPPRPPGARPAVEPANSTPPPVKANRSVSSTPISPKKDHASNSSVRRDSAPQPKLSPFRRSHPWAAVPGKRFYFLSSCPVALRATDLLYFKTEEEARAGGFVRTRVPGCY
jgi:serine/threonine protein kinase